MSLSLGQGGRSTSNEPDNGAGPGILPVLIREGQGTNTVWRIRVTISAGETSTSEAGSPGLRLELPFPGFSPSPRLSLPGVVGGMSYSPGSARKQLLD
jgi:hypothetical protein